MFESYVESGVRAGVVALRDRTGETSVEVHGRMAYGEEPLERELRTVGRSSAPAFPDAGGGLVSTAEDFLAFAR
jgi:hypothetical protein